VVLQGQIEGLLDRELGHAVNGNYPVRIALSQQIAMSCVAETYRRDVSRMWRNGGPLSIRQGGSLKLWRRFE
jgi:hypothetical protein